MRLKFGTKATTLKDLAETKTPEFKLLPSRIVSFEEFQKNPAEVWKGISALGKKVIVRSTFSGEDRKDHSGAGEYLSVPNVDTSDKSQVLKAIEDVFNSYPKQKSESVFIQPFLTKVILSGVAFSYDIETQGPYYVINADGSGGTDSITSGTGSDSVTYYHYRHNFSPSPFDHANLILNGMRKLESIFQTESLDVEFAVLEGNTLVVLQVRPLTFKTENLKSLTDNPAELFDAGQQKVEDLGLPHPFLLGRRTILGMMPDWNPAEMIGSRPKTLSMSLYKELITDNVWAYQRDRYGYRNLRSFPLMVDLYGFPFINTRVCFNSFIPSNLDPEVSEKLVNFYLDKLERNPHLHDKIEFSIVYSCYDFDLDNRIQELKNHSFTDQEIEEIKSKLKTMTEKIVSPTTGLYKEDLHKFKILGERRTEILESELPDLEKVYWLIEDCKRYGTLPFAGVARAAFIGVSLLNSLVKRQVLSEEEKMNFLESLRTVGRSLTEDFSTLPMRDFLKLYGHLRPGTYDIESPRYDQAPEKYFGNILKFPKATKHGHNFRLSLEQLDSIENLLKKEGLGISPIELMRFIKESIEGREYGKFAFTQNISDALFILERWGKENSLSPEDLSHLEIRTIQTMISESRPMAYVHAKIQKEIARNKEFQSALNKFRVPSLITSAKDLVSFKSDVGEPNFIARQVFEGEVMELKDASESMSGRIVLIPSADPGYDWLFTKNIKGLVTMYGGANSHMAIRCAELGIPAVIGVGEGLYTKIKKGRFVEFNPQQRTIKIVS